MKVHYETIGQALGRIIREAASQSRHIEYIELTPTEWDELGREFPLDYAQPWGFGVQLRTYNGVRLEKQR